MGAIASDADVEAGDQKGLQLISFHRFAIPMRSYSTADKEKLATDSLS
jgi:hypothetical protein